MARRPYCPARAYRATRLLNASGPAAAVLITVALVLLLAGIALGACYPARVTASMGIFATGLATLLLAAAVHGVAAWYYRRV